jgi:flavin-dependent dehydrogenase
LSIQLANVGAKVILFEKETYPFHRVCGEYISLESWNFLESLGVQLNSMKLPMINTLELSSPSGRLLRQRLPLGGFGISRYTLDYQLAELAMAAGVRLMQGTKVTDINFASEKFAITCDATVYNATVAAACFGKRSNLDIKWKRNFITNTENRLNNFIGIKYHVTGDYPLEKIMLHCFDQGYCGLVAIDNDQYNLCYLTTAANLKKCDGNIERMEAEILSKNSALKEIFTTAKKLDGSRVTISQVSFDKKSCIEDHVLMLGDAAGMIAPLCGNGMSIALHSSKLAFVAIKDFLDGTTHRMQMESNYSNAWNKQFSSRLKTGRMFQQLTSSAPKTELLLKIAGMFPAIFKRFIAKTHGKNF